MTGTFRERRVVERRWRRANVASVLLLVALPFAAFASALTPRAALSPADLILESYPWKALAPHHTSVNPLMGDVASMFHPWLLYGAREVAEGRFPLWNPHAFAGAPAFAESSDRIPVSVALAHASASRAARGHDRHAAQAVACRSWHVRLPAASFGCSGTGGLRGHRLHVEWTDDRVGAMVVWIGHREPPGGHGGGRRARPEAWTPERRSRRPVGRPRPPLRVSAGSFRDHRVGRRMGSVPVETAGRARVERCPVRPGHDSRTWPRRGSDHSVRRISLVELGVLPAQ